MAWGIAYEIIRVSFRSNFSLICMLVSALLLFGLLWLIETPATFILFAETILMAAYISALVYDFFRKRSYYNLLLKMTEQMEEKSLLGELLTQPHFWKVRF